MTHPGTAFWLRIAGTGKWSKQQYSTPYYASELEHFFSKQIIKLNCWEFFFALFLINSSVNFDQIV